MTIKELEKEKADLLDNNNSGFAFVILILSITLCCLGVIEQIIPHLKVLKVVLIIICGILSIPISNWMINKAHPYPRLREIDTEIEKLSSK